MQKEKGRLPKLIVILGPTASGKTVWSLRAAQAYNGEIISADSRQVYKFMNVGTAKVEGEWKRAGLRKSYVVDGMIHHLIDFLNPGKTFTAAEFRDKAIKYAKLAATNGRTPFLVGGTGLYISAVVDNFKIPRIPPHKKLRRSLEEKTNEQLIKLLEILDPQAATSIGPHNKRRMIRALEVTILSNKPFSKQKKKGEPLFDVLEIGVDVPRDVLHTRIDERVENMIADGLLEEINTLLRKKYHWDLPSMRGIGYQEFRPYIAGTVSLEEAIASLKKHTRQLARRQMTWFRRDKRIQWCRTYEEAEKHIQKFLGI